MTVAEIRPTLLKIAEDLCKKGPGFAQESVVLREIYLELQPKTLEEQQEILSAWHRLFRDGDLAWGYDLENPGPPFYHIPSAA